LLGEYDAALAAIDEAIDASGSIGDIEAQAVALVASSRSFIALGRIRDAEDRLDRAAALVESVAPGRAAARVEAARSSAHMLARQFTAAEQRGQLAMELARSAEDDHVLATAMIQSGIALGMSGDDAGLERIRAGIEVARGVGDDDLVATGWGQIGSGYAELRRYDVAVPALREGIEFAEARESISALHYMTAWLARCELELGNWNAASELASGLARNPRCRGISRFVAMVTLGWLRMRRGDPGVWPLLDEALELARSTGHVQRLWPAAAARAEAAWLEGRLVDEIALVDDVASRAEELGYQPAVDELRTWQRRADGADRGDARSAHLPFGLMAAGRPDLARDAWVTLGCPFEEAMARFDLGGLDDLRVAHRTFDELGAATMRDRSADAIRRLGGSAPRGRAASSRANPHALTNRELSVLALVAAGHTNRRIAEELYISVKTVDHHVSNVLAKLGVRSRAEAAVAAERLGLAVEP
jgi:DNA-binding CsgD family transcriptional regulator